MEKEFVPYELALQLKALGFDEPCFGSWETEYVKVPTYTHSISEFYKNSNHPIGKVAAPTFSQAFRWFREKYGLFIQPNRTIDSEGIWYYFSIASKRTDVCQGSFVYEEAEQACLEKLIEIVKKI